MSYGLPYRFTIRYSNGKVNICVPTEWVCRLLNLLESICKIYLLKDIRYVLMLQRLRHNCLSLMCHRRNYTTINYVLIILYDCFQIRQYTFCHELAFLSYSRDDGTKNEVLASIVDGKTTPREKTCTSPDSEFESAVPRRQTSAIDSDICPES